MTRVLVTGATGFVGRRLIPVLGQARITVRAAVRNPSPGLAQGIETAATGDIGPDTDWRAALDGVDAVVHLAARVHVMGPATPDSDARFQRVNRDGTRALAEAAARAGVKRFVYVSTSKVMGERSGERPFVETDTPAPADAYGRSKWAGEQALAEHAGNMAAVVLRPPLVYGPGAGGNVLSLLKICRLGLPLPLGGIGNARSLVYVDNLTAAIGLCLEHPKAAGHTYFIRDADDVSTPELIRLTATALGRPARVFAVPEALLGLLGALSGRAETVSRLTGTLQVDDGAIRRDLGWTPPIDMVQGLNETAAWFASADKGRDDG